jgi:hypothetical protein
VLRLGDREYPIPRACLPTRTASLIRPACILESDFARPHPPGVFYVAICARRPARGRVNPVGAARPFH